MSITATELLLLLHFNYVKPFDEAALCKYSGE